MASNIQRGTRKMDASDWIRLKRLNGARDYVLDQASNNDVTNPPPTDCCVSTDNNRMDRPEFGISKIRRPASNYTQFKAWGAADYILESKTLEGKVLAGAKLCDCTPTNPIKHNPTCIFCTHDKIEVRKTFAFYVQGVFYYTYGVYTPGGDYSGIIAYLASVYNVNVSDVKLTTSGGSIVITYQITASTSASPDLQVIHSAVAKIAAENSSATGLTFVGDNISGYYTLTNGESTSQPIQLFTPPVVSTVAGNQNFTTVDGPGLSSSFKKPVTILFNKNDNNIYVVDNKLIRKITPSGMVSTFAGSQTQGYQDGKITSTFGPLTTSQAPGGWWGISEQQFNSGNLIDNYASLFAEYTKSTTLQDYYEETKNEFISLGGGFPVTHVMTNYGSGGTCVLTFTGDYATDMAARNNLSANCKRSGAFNENSTLTVTYGTPRAVMFSNPAGMVADSSNNIFVCDLSRIRKITPSGDVTTFAGSDPGYVDGDRTNAKFGYLTGIAIANDNTMYVCDLVNYAVRKISPAGVVSTFAGGSRGYQDGIGSSAKFQSLGGIVIDTVGNIYVCDTDTVVANYIRKITPSQQVTTLCGKNFGGSLAKRQIDGDVSVATFRQIEGITIDKNNNLYVCDYGNYSIRKITPFGKVTTYAGNNTSFGYLDGYTTIAKFSQPRSITVDSTSSNLYLTEFGKSSVMSAYNNYVRKIEIIPAYQTKITIASRNENQSGLAVDSDGNVYIAQNSNGYITKVTPQGDIRKINSQARNVWDVVIDSSNNLYVAVSGDINGVNKITPEGNISTIVYAPSSRPPFQIAVDSIGNVYAVYDIDRVVQKITPTGTITQIGSPFDHFPMGIDVDSSGNIYIGVGNYIKKITPQGNISRIAEGVFSSFGITYIKLDSVGNFYIVFLGITGYELRKLTSENTNTLIYNTNNLPPRVTLDSSGNIYISDYGSQTLTKLVF
jgi:sugar lactone lactonase YvrE